MAVRASDSMGGMAERSIYQLLIGSFVFGHLDGFHILTILHRTTVSIVVQVSLS